MTDENELQLYTNGYREMSSLMLALFGVCLWLLR